MVCEEEGDGSSRFKAQGWYAYVYILYQSPRILHLIFSDGVCGWKEGFMIAKPGAFGMGHVVLVPSSSSFFLGVYAKASR